MNGNLIDENKIQQLIDSLGDMAKIIILDLVDSLENDTRRSITEMRKAAPNQDNKTIRQAAHRLKGSCGNLGAQAAEALCLELESMAQGSIEDATPMITKIEEVCNESMQALRQYPF
jgi:HPt (histidine-containing phosphotransfer) domain-containing protein